MTTLKGSFTKILRSGFRLIGVAVMPVLLITSWNKSESDAVPDNTKTLDNIVVSNAFSWATTQEITFTISAQDNLGSPLQGVRFNLYTALPDSGGVYICGGFTGAEGAWTTRQPLPSYMKEITAVSGYVGLVREMTLPLQGAVFLHSLEALHRLRLLPSRQAEFMQVHWQVFITWVPIIRREFPIIWNL